MPQGERDHYVSDENLHDAGADIAEALGFSEQDREVQPEAQLFRAVIHRAFADAFPEPEVAGPELAAGDQREEGARGRTEAHRANARRWLTSDIDRDDRHEVCDMAGVEERKVRALAERKLADVKEQETLDQEMQAEQAEETVAQTRRQESAFKRNLLRGSLLDIRSTRRGPYASQKPTQKPAPLPGLPVA